MSEPLVHDHEGRDYYRAHQYSSCHRKQIERSEVCGCFYCLSVFPPTQIEEWLREGDGTALCPECSIDSVIGSASGFPITREFLQKMHDYWFAGA
ncbi:MAG TPA: cytoplasmic protein [Opitutaceae bacterium]|nr:MAG: hypothetical protein BWY57_03524 [Betaproteobacteria bacterium ADurb.Bin341]HOY54691.1 cytoplasmic protein [Opitutaceae bacterium]HPG18141.1 cytoplasmic protein [Opitutaceae bacterium]HPO00438.1 cytoplasmic protein [Opitutaceae bacterium]